jgi:hypothetical protein
MQERMTHHTLLYLACEQVVFGVFIKINKERKKERKKETPKRRTKSEKPRENGAQI